MPVLFARHLPRFYRLALLLIVAGLLYRAALVPQPPDDVPLESATTFFPTADRLALGDPRLGGQTVLDKQGRMLGLLLTTSPHSDDLVGYAGPSNLLIALDSARQVIGVKLLSSGDTRAHVEQIEQRPSFWQQFVGASPTQHLSKVEAVSGSTLTSLAMAEAIERRLHGTSLSLRFPEAVSLGEIQKLFPAARTFALDNPRNGWNMVRDETGRTLGFVLRTSPYSDNVRGYSGPTESLIAIDAAGQMVVGVLVRKSYDTADYVDRVRDDEEFLQLLAGRTLADWAGIDFAKEGIEGVSGATQTSFAVAEGIKRRAIADQAAAAEKSQRAGIQPGLLAIIAGGLAMTFTPLRANRRLRLLWQAVLVVAFAFWLGDLVSLALLAGWARHGVPWQTAPSVVLLVAVALIVPWATRRQIYCQQLCPHGAAQTWLGQFKRLHVRIPPAVQRWLARLPAALLAIGILLATFALGFDLAWLEPFDAWVLGSAAAVSLGIAIAGLVVSLFVPQAYCRFGCPTGELLRLIKSGGKHDRLHLRDLLSGVLVLVVAAALLGPQLVAGLTVTTALHDSPEEGQRQVGQFSGKAFGTTWSVKLRGKHDVAALKAAVAAELERIESTLSHWRPESFTSQFNASETTLETELPAELVALVARALEISRLTGGEYDITIAPLVDAWGYGPSGQHDSPPTAAELAEILQRVGWEQLVADTEFSTLRKKQPQLTIDLGSLLQGYAADRVKQILDGAGAKECLIDVGGELRTGGTWQVAIEDPNNAAGPLRTLELTNAALATSGVYRARHLISPRTGRPVAATATLCAVVAPTGLAADAWATALLAVGLPDALQLADEQHLAVLMLDDQQKVHVNAGGEAIFGSQ
jgi:thiamine biosynthesis lipoprotein ApbE/Na+-translocating ferredoxin:NAD+ oxidoreductase RnfG subunit